MLECHNPYCIKKDEDRSPIARSSATFNGKGKDTILTQFQEII